MYNTDALKSIFAVCLVLGQASSLFGNYILRLALSMYVLEVTGSAAVFAGILAAATVATILGSAATGILTGKLKSGRLFLVLAAIGLCIIPAGVVFLFPVGEVVKYAVNVAAFCGMQAAISIFSIFAVSMIQQSTPDHLLGKVMAYTSAITMCAQPVGQVVYGFLFDGFREAVHLVLIPTGIVVCVIGLSVSGFFRRMEEEQDSVLR